MMGAIKRAGVGTVARSEFFMSDDQGRIGQ